MYFGRKRKNHRSLTWFLVVAPKFHYDSLSKYILNFKINLAKAVLNRLVFADYVRLTQLYSAVVTVFEMTSFCVMALWNWDICVCFATRGQSEMTEVNLSRRLGGVKCEGQLDGTMWEKGGGGGLGEMWYVKLLVANGSRMLYLFSITKGTKWWGTGTTRFCWTHKLNVPQMWEGKGVVGAEWVRCQWWFYSGGRYSSPSGTYPCCNLLVNPTCDFRVWFRSSVRPITMYRSSTPVRRSQRLYRSIGRRHSTLQDW